MNRTPARNFKCYNARIPAADQPVRTVTSLSVNTQLWQDINAEAKRLGTPRARLVEVAILSCLEAITKLSPEDFRRLSARGTPITARPMYLPVADHMPPVFPYTVPVDPSELD